LEAARAVAYQLREDAEVTLWNEGVFGPGRSYLESLVTALDRFDFAVLIFTPDDLVLSRDVSVLAPRDNIMFELGLFMGRLGRSRTFVVMRGDRDLKLPTDLSGVTVTQFDGNRSDGNLIAAVGPACLLIRRSIKDLGLSEARGLKRLQDATTEVETVSSKVARLVDLLARSRVTELEVLDKQFGEALAPGP
jgi:predicted nucleotide-binding protein